MMETDVKENTGWDGEVLDGKVTDITCRLYVLFGQVEEKNQWR